jgi:hypothetical protein
MKAGLKAWGDPAKAAVKEEMKQLHMRDTFQPRHWKSLTPEEKERLLETHLFLKKKRCGKIKGRTVAGGNKQRGYIDKHDASSPTVSTQALLLTCIVEAHEGRDVMTIDIPNAFIQTRVEDPQHRVLVKIKGYLAELLLEFAPEVYGDYAYVDKKGILVIIAECWNAIYGTMIAGLLYYIKFCGTLDRLGFLANPYEACVHNRIAAGKQQTVCFHVDDVKSSGDKAANDQLVEELRSEYEHIQPDGSGKMTVHRGKVHEYLGMTLDYGTAGVCKVSMPKYTAEILSEAEKVMDCKGTKSCAAPKDLFCVDSDSPKLDHKRSEFFHSIVAKILFATKRARPDTATAIAYLMTRVQDANEDDWQKLCHLIKYIRETKDLVLTLGAKGDNVLRWWVDGSHTVHPNMRGHTGGGLSMGLGYPVSQSNKQKLNTRSSTESELVAVDDLMPTVLWTRQFLNKQGFEVVDNIVYQDNQAAILLEKNGRASSGKRTKHINTRFFFITDRIGKKEVTVKWCPTEDMTADFWTKPLQGASFRRMRDLIMGVTTQGLPRVSKTKKKKGEKTKGKQTTMLKKET